jgi:Oxygenase domain of the 2OGFeDO superfamily
MFTARLQSKVADKAVAELEGKVLGADDYDVLLTGPAFITMNDGRPLACYLPGVLKGIEEEHDVYNILHPLYRHTTNNRGSASGTKRIMRGSGDKVGIRSDAMSVSSEFLGAADPQGVYKYCRLTAWTGQHMPQWQQLQPFFKLIGEYFERYVPQRYQNQLECAKRTDPAWIIPETPFSTITVNNSYSTGVHKDRGDLDSGFSALACLRRGEYTGGVLTFPQYRIGADMQDGDLMLMDAHQWHGNTVMTCKCGERVLKKPCETCGAERISVVCYYRTRIERCGTPEQEYQRALNNTERRSKL